MGKILRINNLSEDTTAEDLKTLFQGAGAIAGAKISRHKETGQSNGFGYVKMESTAAARSALTMLNGQILKGNQIRVVAVRPPASGKTTGTGPRPIKLT